MENYHAVIVFDEGEGQPGYCVLAHNLNSHDAVRLHDRLDKQYDLDSFIILHSIYHADSTGEKGATEYVGCHNLMDDIIERASAHAKGVVS